MSALLSPCLRCIRWHLSMQGIPNQYLAAGLRYLIYITVRTCLVAFAHSYKITPACYSGFAATQVNPDHKKPFSFSLLSAHAILIAFTYSSLQVREIVVLYVAHEW